MTQTANTEYATKPNGYLEDYVCRKCKEDIKLSNIDDVGEPFFQCPRCGILNKNEIKRLNQNVKCGDCIYWRSSSCPEKGGADFNAFFANRDQNALCSGRYFEPKQKQRRKKKGSKKNSKKADDKEKPKEKFAPFIELMDGRLAEQAYDETQVFFLVYNPKTEKVEKLHEIPLETIVLKPIDNDEVYTATVLLPSDVEEYVSEEQLMEDIRAYLNRWHEAPNPLSRTLDVFYCFLSYIYDLVPQLPYRRYLAPWGKGKSAWLETLGWICYRGIVLAGSDTDKSVVRKMNNWRGTALIDEADFGDSSFYAFLVKILNIGYDHKTGFYHRSDDNDPKKTLSYNVYGAKLLATRQKYKDLALESRCLTTVGRQNIHAIPLFRMNNFLKEAQHLRNKLTLWRFKNYNRIKEQAAQLEDKDIASQVYNGAEGISSRVKQVILPLWLIAGDTMKKTLTELAQTIDNHLKIEDPEYLLELQAKDAVRKISDLLEDDNDESVNIRNLVNILYEGSRAFYEIPLATISRTILAERGMKEDEITVSDVTSVSKSLKGVFETNLGFAMRIGKKRRRVVIIPADWAKVDSAKHKNLFDFEAGDPHKDVHQDTYVHQSERKKPVERFFPEHNKNGKNHDTQKKKPQCKHLITKENQPFCEWLQSFLADPQKCGPDCDGWEAPS